jgi:hypothetical protein
MVEKCRYGRGRVRGGSCIYDGCWYGYVGMRNRYEEEWPEHFGAKRRFESRYLHAKKRRNVVENILRFMSPTWSNFTFCISCTTIGIEAQIMLQPTGAPHNALS